MSSSKIPHTYATTLVGFGDAEQAATVERALNSIPGVTVDIAYSTGRAQITVLGDDEMQALTATLAAYGCVADLHGTADQTPRDAKWDDESRSLRQRIAMGLPLTALVVAFSYLPALRFDHWQWLVAGLAGIVTFGVGRDIHLRALEATRHLRITSDVLYSSALIVLYGVSIAQLFVGHSGDLGFNAMPPVTAIETGPGERLYFDAAAVAALAVLLARLVERRSQMQALWQLRSAARLVPEQATLIHAGVLTRINSRDVSAGDLVLVGTGERSPVDGVVTSGAAPVDTSMITGATAGSQAVRGDWLPAGSQVLSGELIVRAKQVGDQTHAATLAQVAEESPLGDMSLGGLAGSYARHAVHVVALTAVATGMLWMFWAPTPMQATAAAAAVLLVGAPVALNLARPMAVLRTMAAAVPYGVFFRRTDVLDACRRADVVVVENNGHVGTQMLQVADVEPMPGYDATEVLGLASGVLDGLNNTGPLTQLADLLHEAADAHCDVLWEAEGVTALDDGAAGTIDGKSIACGSLMTIEDYLARQHGLTDEQVRSAVLICSRVIRESGAEGKRELVVTQNDRIVGVVIVSATSAEVYESPLDLVHELGIETYLFTDQPAGAAEVAKQRFGARHVRAELTAVSACNEVRELQKAGHRVAYLARHDASTRALEAADIAVQVGNTEDGVLPQASILCVSPDLSEAAGALQLGALGARRVEQYVFCAVAYNAVALPIAFTGWITPMVAAMLSLLPVVLVSRLVPGTAMPPAPVHEMRAVRAAEERDGERVKDVDSVDTPAMGIPAVPPAVAAEPDSGQAPTGEVTRPVPTPKVPAPRVPQREVRTPVALTSGSAASSKPTVSAPRRVRGRPKLRPLWRRRDDEAVPLVVGPDEVLAPTDDGSAIEAARSEHTWFEKALETIDRNDPRPAKRPDRSTQRAIAEDFWDEPLPLATGVKRGANPSDVSGRRPREVKARALRRKIKADRAAQRRQR